MSQAGQGSTYVQKLGTFLFWVVWPALYCYLLIGKRTRVVVQSGDEFLVVKGWLSSGNWQLPGGGLHWREPSPAGLLRELREETGIELESSDLKLVSADNVCKQGFHFRFDLYHVVVRQKPDVKLQAHELLAYKWLPLQTALSSASERLNADTIQSLQLISSTEPRT